MTPSPDSRSRNSADWQRLHKQSWKAIYAQGPALLAFSLAFRPIAGAPLLLTPPYRDLYADDHPFIALKKGTQVFGTEYLMNSALFWAFSGRARGATIMFLPTSELVRDFVQLRLDPAIAADPDLRAALTAPVGTAPNRLGLKQFARGHLLVHGADSYRQLAANPADGLCIDEYDLMAADVLPQMLQRLGSSPESRVRVASTPRLAGTGIDALYQQGTQYRYHYPCPACGLNQALEWPDSVLREAAVLGCRRCRAFMDLFAEGEWVAGAPDQETIHSYHLPRWYSPAANIPQILREADSDTFGTEQTFANYIAAEVYAPDGAQLTLPDLDAVRRPYGLEDTYHGQPCDMGIDVGKRLHVVIREARQAEGPFPRQLRFAGEVTFPELDALVERLHVRAGLIDSQPETYAAIEFANHQHTVIGLADYTRQQPGHQALPARGAEPPRLKINRTQAIDQLVAEFRAQALSLPAEARRLGGGTRGHYGAYYAHLLASQRVVEQDGEGNWRARWVERGPDHYAHAEVYCLLADELELGGTLLMPRQI